jgi:hypothetical protein
MPDPVIERREERTVVEHDSTAWMGAIFGILAVLALVFFYTQFYPLPERTASNTTITTTTEKVVPPAAPEKPAVETKKTETTTQSQ